MKFQIIVSVSFALAAAARPRYVRRADFTLQNGEDAIALNNQFASLTADSPCQAGEDACVNNDFAQCVSGKFVTQSCGSGLICAALPLVNSAGTSITCTTAADRDARIAATGATSAASSSSGSATATKSTAAASSTSAASSNSTSDDAQSSLTLLQSVIATGFANDGQDKPTAGQVASATSKNNFINFCATIPNKNITNGQQITQGSCNPAPMGVIASTANMPSSKFVSPKNGATITANKNFTIQMAIQNLNTGFFTNPEQTYFAAPQTVDDQGNINGHSHVVIDAIPSLDTTTPTNPTKFAFFAGLNNKAENGVLSVVVPGGLPAGTYRLASINSAANHQPALVAVAQHGALDDMVYFTAK